MLQLYKFFDVVGELILNKRVITNFLKVLRILNAMNIRKLKRTIS